MNFRSDALEVIKNPRENNQMISQLDFVRYKTKRNKKPRKNKLASIFLTKRYCIVRVN